MIIHKPFPVITKTQIRRLRDRLPEGVSVCFGGLPVSDNDIDIAIDLANKGHERLKGELVQRF